MDIQYKSNTFLQEQKLRLLKPDLKKNDNNYIKYELIDNLRKANSLGETTVYLSGLMELLWKQPKIVAKIILNASNKEMSENLSYFFCHNFYENILSPNYIEYNLLYLITLILKEEIKNIPKKSAADPIKCLDLFLNNTQSSIFLEQFQKKNDVQTFFNTILINIMQDLELSSSNKEIIFNLNNIEAKFKDKNIYPDSRSQSRDIEYNLSILSNNYMNSYDFFNNYIIDITPNYFNFKIQECKDLKDNKMIEYFLYHSNSISSDKHKNIYNSEIFKKKNTGTNLDSEVLDEYLLNFETTINLINGLLKNLLDNLYLLPYSIKCICKIIFSLIDKNFKEFNTFHKNAFISKFFFEKLFSPIFQNPALGALINSFIISTQTIKNLEEISKIILMFTSGNLFKNNKKESEFYTPFNAYFISKMGDLFKFYEEIQKVELPLFIQKLINDELDENYDYDFFKENPEEVVYHFSTCFNIDELYTLIEIMDKIKKKIFDVPNVKEKEKKEEKEGKKEKEEKEGKEEKSNLKKLKIIFDKLTNSYCKESIKKARNNHEYEIIKIPIYNKKKKEIIDYKETKGRKIIKYYLIYQVILNEEFSKHINIIQNKKFFNIEENNSSENLEGDEENIQNRIVKVKNYFCTILFNFKMLVKTDFEGDKIISTVNILNELKKLMKSSNNMLIVNFPSQWYVNSLLDYLGKIPNQYIENDYELLITELQKNVDDSIKSINFEGLSILIDKMNFATRGKNYYENVINLVTDMKINKNAQNIVEKENLEIEILFKYNDKKKEFKVYKTNKDAVNLHYFDSVLDAPREKGIKECNSISSFTRHFPNFKKYKERYKKKDLFDFLKEMQVAKQINTFFKLIKDSLKAEQNIKEDDEFLIMFNKIYDYVLEKLYEKIYPTALSSEDIQIYEICEKLKDIEPEFFTKSKKNQIFESFLPDITNYLLQIEKEKSVRKKILNLTEIFECMDNLSKFNGGKNLDLDTQVNILCYAVVKAKPTNIYTNYRYIEIFMENMMEKKEGQNLLELKLVCDYLIKNYSNNSKNIIK